MCELQKKVKVLQQRHRRHLEKLVGLENTVSQLRQSNLLNEERLQLLERVFIGMKFRLAAVAYITQSHLSFYLTEIILSLCFSGVRTDQRSSV